MKKVLVFGTFDGLHFGHLSFFKQAKKYGNCLIVVVSRDKTVRRIKKHSPKFSEKERLRAVKGVKLVDKAELGSVSDPYKIIKKLKPDVICLGYDQMAFTKNLPKKIKEVGLKTKIYRLKPYQPQKYHSFLIKKHAGH